MVKFRSRLAFIAALSTIALAGCADSGSLTEPDDTTASRDDGTAAAADTQPGSDTPPGDGYERSDEGTGTVTIAGTTHEDFEGECEFTRSFGAQPVPDPFAEDVRLILGVDNFDSGDPDAQSFTAISNRSFRHVNSESGFKSTFDSIDVTGPVTEGTSADIALVRLVGSTSAGSSVEMEIVCVLDKP
ncbi:hypothetical protein O7543_15260 [Solwaraspora sp. WMMA2080]|uniref:hypothetical protein n=1 Tax=unclassified Solwaraspora TaxID=2627926 RepID=UPI00248BAAB9|nr:MULTISPECIES: hypothetical protein [unclassified Solwaraspora]WBB97785.1 hypothetical protein O7553_02085 [Solwaraspora sp. WMMA2059]WBC18325.1 hypothetical protein O7543_15260 [Solwaraspora sp. WMMA2080]